MRFCRKRSSGTRLRRCENQRMLSSLITVLKFLNQSANYMPGCCRFWPSLTHCHTVHQRFLIPSAAVAITALLCLPFSNVAMDTIPTAGTQLQLQLCPSYSFKKVGGILQSPRRDMKKNFILPHEIAFRGTRCYLVRMRFSASSFIRGQ